MSINLCAAMDQRRVSKFGKYFGSIDFYVESTSKQLLKRFEKNVRVGELVIGSRTYKLTLDQIESLVYDIAYNERFVISGYEYTDLTRKELERILETLQNAKQVFFQKYRFGM